VVRRSWRRRLGRRPFEAIAVFLVILLVAVLVISIAPDFGGAGSETIPGGLAIGPVVAVPSPTFWAVGGHAVKWLNASLSAQFNATPIEMIRFGGGGDTENSTTGVSYSSNGVPSNVGNPYTGFLNFCKWRNCKTIFAVPGEINEPGAAADTVRYVEQTLGFHPQYWSIGNEPQLWTHYGIPWTQWRATDDSTPTPQEYAVTVQNYIAAMKSVDSGIQVIGIQSAYGGTYANPWIQAVVSLDGPEIAAIAYHSYPASIGPQDGSVQEFLSAGFSSGFPNDYRTTQAEVASACTSCHIPVLLDEYNGAVLGVDTPLVESYPDVPLVGAAVARALLLNVTQFSFFDLQGVANLTEFGLLAPNGAPRPTYTLYSAFFDHLADAAIDNTTLLGGPGDVAAVVGTNTTTESLFLANANATIALRLSLNGSGFPVGDRAVVYGWGPDEPSPTLSTFGAGALPAVWTIPAQGVIEIDVALLPEAASP
jgi:hypothetical protein